MITKDGAPITGLYATGNCTASVMGETYPGPGATIGASMVFGYAAAMDIAENARKKSSRSPKVTMTV